LLIASCSALGVLIGMGAMQLIRGNVDLLAGVASMTVGFIVTYLLAKRHASKHRDKLQK